MLAMVAVLAFYIIISILAGHQIMLPRSTSTTYRIPLTRLTINQNLTTSSSSSTSTTIYTLPLHLGAPPPLPLLLSTSTPDLLLQPHQYTASIASEDQYYSVRTNITLDGGVSNLQSSNAASGGTTTAFEVEFAAMMDTVRVGDFEIPAQAFGVLAEELALVKGAEGVVGGIVGLGGRGSVFTDGGGEASWVGRWGSWGAVPEVRFGVMLNSRDGGGGGGGGNGTAEADGALFIGGLDGDSLAGGELVSMKFSQPDMYSVMGMVGVGGEMVPGLESVGFLFATGTEKVYGPRDSVQSLFDALGQVDGSQMESFEIDGRVVGSYPCERPPQIEFAFPYHVTERDPERVWEIEKEMLGQEMGDGRCRCVIEGVEELDDGGGWILGLSFMVGKYVDFNLDNQTIGLALLKGKDD